VHRIALVIALASVGCHKQADLANAKKVFSRWDLGWRRSRPCILGRVGRSPDPALQVELAQFFEERGECPPWFTDPDRNLPNVSALDNDLKRDEALAQAENAVNIFNELTPEDLTDELAPAMTDLQAAVENARFHWPKGVPELVTARAKVRKLLGLPEDGWEITSPITVTDLAVQAIPPVPRPESKWRIDDADGKLAVTDAAGKHLFDLPPGVYDMIADAAEPIVWQHSFEPSGVGDERVTVYQATGDKWSKHEFRDVVFIGKTGKRLDLVFRTKPATLTGEPAKVPSWTSFSPGKPQAPVTKLTGVFAMQWACSADNALWLRTTDTEDSSDGSVVRYDVATGTPGAPAHAPVSGSAPICDDTAVAYYGMQVWCAAGHDCELDAAAGGSAALVDGKLVSVKFKPDSVLLDVRVSHGGERVFRMPPKSFVAQLDVRDHKPIVVLADGKTLPLPWPLDKK
jgi:hypothetical protein